MATDQMYALAFQFKREKPWKQIPEADHFAAVLPDGKTGYCVLTGSQGEHLSLSVYVGEEAYQTILPLLYDQNPVTGLQEFELFIRQDCLQCSLESKDDVLPEIADEVRDYARRNGFRLAGANAFPSFLRFAPARMPVPFEGSPEEDYILTALHAALALQSGYRSGDTFSLPDNYMYLLEEQEQEDPRQISFSAKVIPRPEWKAEYPQPAFRNDIGLAKLKKCRRTEAVQCDAIHLPAPITDRYPPYYAALILCVSEADGTILPVRMPEQAADSTPDDLVNSLLETLLDADCYPRKILVMNRQTQALLSSFCKKAKIRLVMEDTLEELVMAEEDLEQNLSSAHEDASDETDYLYEMIQYMMNAEDAELLKLPRELVTGILGYRKLLPEDLVRRLERLFPPN